MCVVRVCSACVCVYLVCPGAMFFCAGSMNLADADDSDWDHDGFYPMSVALHQHHYCDADKISKLGSLMFVVNKEYI